MDLLHTEGGVSEKIAFYRVNIADGEIRNNVVVLDFVDRIVVTETPHHQRPEISRHHIQGIRHLLVNGSGRVIEIVIEESADDSLCLNIVRRCFRSRCEKRQPSRLPAKWRAAD